MLLSQVIRRAAITGRNDVVGDGILGRQGGRWAQQWVGAAFPPAARADRATVEALRRSGALTEDEAKRALKARGL